MRAVTVLILPYLAIVLNSCQKEPLLWDGAKLTQPRDQLTVEQLLEDTSFPLIDMSFFAKPPSPSKILK